MSTFNESKANAATANAKTAAQEKSLMRKVDYKEVYDLIYECDHEAKIELGNGEYVSITDFNDIMEIGIKTNDGFFCNLGTLFNKAYANGDWDNCVGTYAQLLEGKTDLIALMVDELNKYIETKNRKEE